MQQRSLFPDGFELLEAALAELRAMQITKALAFVQRARAVDATMPGLRALQQALEWLAARRTDSASVTDVARTLTDLARAVEKKELDGDAVARIEAGLGAFLAQRLPEAPAFLDDEETLSTARLALLRGDAESARHATMALLGDDCGDHAGLWFDHADACEAVGRLDEANASYVRALLLDPRAGHAHRTSRAPLAATWRQAIVAGTRESAADLLLAEAWIAGVLSIPPGNRWLSPAQRRMVHDRSAASAAWRFSLLVYLDRSAPAGDCDVEAREEMATLFPDLFRQFLAAVQRHQG